MPFLRRNNKEESQGLQTLRQGAAVSLVLSFFGKIRCIYSELGGFSDISLNQLQCIRRVTNNLITMAPSIAFFAEIVFVKNISAGAMGVHDQGAVLQRCFVVVSMLICIFYRFSHFFSFLDRLSGSKGV